MNLNLVVIAGRLAVAPEDLNCPDQLSRLLITVQTGTPSRRVDLLPVVAPTSSLPDALETGAGVWVAGSLQRRFRPSTGRSRLEVVASQVEQKRN